MSAWTGLSDRELARRWRAARALRSPLEERGETTCFRLAHGAADGLEGLSLDWFAGVAVLSLYRELSKDEERRLVESAASALSPDALYLKRRPREARIAASTRSAELAPEAPAAGAPTLERLGLEQGLRFLIRPAQGLSVGLYLDMRETRAWIRAEARGRTVLNLFAYTCGFGVCALAGGASRAVNVDLSRKVLDWGEANARANGLSSQRDDFLSGDVFEWLSRMAKRDLRFSLVILDPPGFSTARGRAFSAASHYGRLVEAAAPLVAEGGMLVSSCNVAQLPPGRFEAMIDRGLGRAGRAGRLAKRLGPSPVDFPTLEGEAPALKVRVHALD